MGDGLAPACSGSTIDVTAAMAARGVARARAMCCGACVLRCLARTGPGLLYELLPVLEVAPIPATASQRVIWGVKSLAVSHQTGLTRD